MPRKSLTVAIAAILISVVSLVAGQLYLWMSAGDPPVSGEGFPPPKTWAVFGIAIVSSVTCLLTVPYAAFGLLKDKSRRTPGNLLIVGAGAVLLSLAVAYLVRMFV
jgi:hypothetical protein